LVRKKVKVTKKQMKEDTFISTTIRAWEYIKEHENQFFIGLIVLILIVAAGGWYRHSRALQRENAITQLSQGLFAYRRGDLKTAREMFKITYDKFGNTKEGSYALYFMAKCDLEMGQNSKAMEGFKEYIEKKSSKYPYYHDAALDGLATALENERRYKEAADIYMKLLKNMRTNDFMEDYYLRKAADNLKLCGRYNEAIEILRTLKEKVVGLDRRDIEVEIAILEAEAEQGKKPVK